MIDTIKFKEWTNTNTIFEVDIETTGFDFKKDEIVQIAYKIRKKGKVLVERNFKIKPFLFDKKTNEEKNKINIILGYDLSIEKEKEEFELPSVVFERLIQDFENANLNGEKMYVFGYNVAFDIQFMIDFFYQYSDFNGKNLFKYIYPERKIDVMYLLPFIEMSQNIKFKNYKLEYLNKVFKIETNSHDALEDITSTKKLYNIFFKKLFLRD